MVVSARSGGKTKSSGVRTDLRQPSQPPMCISSDARGAQTASEPKRELLRTQKRKPCRVALSLSEGTMDMLSEHLPRTDSRPRAFQRPGHRAWCTEAGWETWLVVVEVWQNRLTTPDYDTHLAGLFGCVGLFPQGGHPPTPLRPTRPHRRLFKSIPVGSRIRRGRQVSDRT